MTLDEALRIGQMLVMFSMGALNLILFIKARSLKKLDAVEEKIDQQGRDAIEMDKRMSVLETTVKHMPTHNDLLGIRGELNQLNRTVSTVAERSTNTDRIVQLIQEHLMESKP